MTMSDIAHNGIWHPLTTKLGLTDEERLAAERAAAIETRRRATCNLRRLAHDDADFALLADALGLNPQEGLDA